MVSSSSLLTVLITELISLKISELLTSKKLGFFIISQIPHCYGVYYVVYIITLYTTIIASIDITLPLISLGSLESTGYPNGLPNWVSYWVAVKINDQIVSAEFASQRRFNSFTSLPFTLQLLFVRRPLIFYDFFNLLIMSLQK